MRKFSFLIVLLLLCGQVFAKGGKCGENVKWNLDKNGVLTISGTGDMYDSEWDSKEKAYNTPFYKHRESIISIIINEGVTSIGNNAFQNCTGLTSVTIPNSVTSIGDYAFMGCNSLTSVTIPNSVTSIGMYAFYGCSGLTSVTIPNSVTSIGGSAFYGCTGLTSVTIPNSVTSIGDYAFSNCTGLASVIWNAKNCADFAWKNTPFYDLRSQITSFTFSNEVEHIPAYLCNDMYNLTSVTIGNSVRSIGVCAFEGCTGLTSVTIPNSVTSIGQQVFSQCSSLTSVTIPNSVTSIGREAFYNCSGLTSVTIPNSVTSIGKYAFYGCSSLTSMEIPNSVTSIGNGAFQNCTGLTSVTIGNSVTSIGDYAFMGCNSLTSVTIPNSVTSIGMYAFYGCSGLTSVTIPNSVTSIGGSAFYGCSGLTSVTIPNSVTSIVGYAFSNCTGLTSVTIPNSVTSIGYHAFSNCSGLKSVYISDLAAWCAISFGSSSANPLYYAHNLYLNGTVVTNLTIPNSVTTIGSYSFYGCSGLTSVTIPHSVTSIGENAFYGCSGLTSIEIPNSVTSIGSSAFKWCSSLAIVNYPKGLDISKANIPSSAKLIAYDPSVGQQNNNAASPKQFPLLALVEGSLVFSDASNNKRIEGGEKCNVRFKITNKGKSEAKNCKTRVSMSGNTAGITAKIVELPAIAPGKTYDVSIPITSTTATQNGKVSFAIEVIEPNGFGVSPFNLAVDTKAYDPPYLQVVDYNIASNSGKIRKMEPFMLTFNLQNTKYGVAEDVKLKINLPNNIFIVEGEKELSYHQIRSGEVVKVQLSLIANNNYTTSTIPITIDVKEKYGKFAENRKLDIALNQTTSSTIQIAAKDEPQQERKEIQLAMMKSEVDRNIPVAQSKNQNTFVLIIANEHYQQVASVPFALNDGNIFREYCIKTLGIGEKHIKYLSDATGNQIKAGVNWLNNVVETFDEPQIIVYYAGHGIPDESSKSAYLLPVDGAGTDVTTGYKLDDLYATLGNMPASRIAVFMDACFSGSKREQGMLASARGVALKAKSGVPQGNMVVFSAAQGDETAYPNREQQHGLFTYYLLKKLQDTEGNVTLKDLGDYVTKQVSQQSLLLNDKRQTPSVIPSTSLGSEWQTWKLK